LLAHYILVYKYAVPAVFFAPFTCW